MIKFPCITIIDDNLLFQALKQLNPVEFKVFMYLVHHAQNYEETGWGGEGNTLEALQKELSLEYEPLLGAFIELRSVGWLDAFVVTRDTETEASASGFSWRMKLSTPSKNRQLNVRATLMETHARERPRDYLVIGTEILPIRKAKSKQRNSGNWQQLRSRVIERDGGCCTECGSTDRPTVHHLTYENEGHEKLEDLVTLCVSCHAKKGRRRSES
jgi:hypothetical protein